jgi:hypothetical protein
VLLIGIDFIGKGYKMPAHVGERFMSIPEVAQLISIVSATLAVLGKLYTFSRQAILKKAYN